MGMQGAAYSNMLLRDGVVPSFARLSGRRRRVGLSYVGDCVQQANIKAGQGRAGQGKAGQGRAMQGNKRTRREKEHEVGAW